MRSPEAAPNATNELAKERTRAAAERTLSAWINNCLVLIGFGVTIDQVYPNLERALLLRPDQTITLFPHIIGLSFIGVSIGLLLIVVIQHVLVLQSLSKPGELMREPSFMRLNQMAIATIVTFGVLSLVIIALTA